jgi:hypothetical protein
LKAAPSFGPAFVQDCALQNLRVKPLTTALELTFAKCLVSFPKARRICVKRQFSVIPLATSAREIFNEGICPSPREMN